MSVALKVTTVAPLSKLIDALVPVATSDPPTNHWVDAIVPSLSVAVAVKLTVFSCAAIGVCNSAVTTRDTYRWQTLGASTVMVAVVDVDAPSLSVALKVTTVSPFDNAMLALVPVATSNPPTAIVLTR